MCVGQSAIQYSIVIIFAIFLTVGFFATSQSFAQNSTESSNQTSTQPTNQTSTQSTNQTSTQSTNQTSTQSTNQTSTQSTNQTSTQSTNQTSTQSSPEEQQTIAASDTISSETRDERKSSAQNKEKEKPDNAPMKKESLQKLESHVYTPDASKEKRVIVLYREKATNQDLADLANNNAVVKKKFKILPAVSAVVNEKDVAKLRANINVVDVFDDIRVFAFLSDSVPQINADQIYGFGKGGAGVNVCIIDSGIDDSHPALNTVVAEYDFVNNDNDASDDYGHGTHVAGIVASTDVTFTGVAPDSSLMAAKALDEFGY